MTAGRFHQDQSGTKIAMLSLLEKTDQRTKNGSFKYRVKCECGVEKVVGFSQMTTGRTKSCGCLQKRTGVDSPFYKHGLSRTKDYGNQLFMRHRYGLEYSDYLKIVEEQKGVCAICGEPPDVNQRKKRLNIDHCHKTGQIRGLLCDLCNRALGLLRDDTKLLERSIQYLNKYANAR